MKHFSALASAHNNNKILSLSLSRLHLLFNQQKYLDRNVNKDFKKWAATWQSTSVSPIIFHLSAYLYTASNCYSNSSIVPLLLLLLIEFHFLSIVVRKVARLRQSKKFNKFNDQKKKYQIFLGFSGLPASLRSPAAPFKRRTLVHCVQYFVSTCTSWHLMVTRCSRERQWRKY